MVEVLVGGEPVAVGEFGGQRMAVAAVVAAVVAVVLRFVQQTVVVRLFGEATGV